MSAPGINNAIKPLWLLAILGLGAALGYSNLLEFPVMVGLHGGSAYLLVFFLCQLLIALPVMLSELFLGRRSRADTLTGWQGLSVGRVVARSWRFLGLAMLVAGLLTIAAYSVLFSWSVMYLDAFWTGSLRQDTDFTRHFLSVIQQADVISQVQLGFFGFMGLLLLLGFRTGLMPIMMAMVATLLVALLAGVFVVTGLDDAAMKVALTQVFGWRPEQIDASVFFQILNQAFFSLGIGVGALWLVGAQAHAKASMGKVVLLILAFDWVASVLAALTLWQLDLNAVSERWSFTELLFQQLPRLMDSQAVMLFFIAMVLSGVTSTLLIFENLVRAVTASLQWPRYVAIGLVVLVASLLGLAGQLSFNVGQSILWYGRSIYDNYVVISSGILVPLSGALLAIFVGWVMRSADARDEWQPTRVWRFWAWRWSLRILSIIAILLVFFGALDQQFGLPYQQAFLVVIGLVLSAVVLRLVRNWSR